MTQRTLRRALRAAVVCAAIPALAPAAALASTYTVDDDGKQCPNAGFTTIQSAVDQAAPWDTIVVCDGLYEEQSRPASGNQSPSAPGSLNGLTITKPLTIRGAGANKVTIRPRRSVTTLAGAAPYLRDGGGNVITVSKQSRDGTDINTMFVDIFGVTVDSPSAYAEAGVAFFDANGAIRNSVVGPLHRAANTTDLAARPYGWGVVMSNHYQGAEAGPHREVSIESSLVTGYQSGGILFDDARGPDGDPATLQRSGIVQYGYVRNTTVQGSGPNALIPQTGIEYHAGQRGQITRSTITGNYFTSDPRRSAGILLTDAETGDDPSAPGVLGFYAYDNILTGNGYGLFNANADNSAVRLGAPAVATPGAVGLENWWGCSGGPIVGGPSADGTATACQGVSGDDTAGDASVVLGATRTSPQIFPSVPGATADAAPTARFGDPVDGTVRAGQPVDPVVVAGDDFGVRSVSLEVDGQPAGEIGHAPYEFSGAWTPRLDQIGSTHTLKATAVDSAGKSTTTTATVTVVAPAGDAPRVDAPAPGVGPVAAPIPVGTAAPSVTGSARVGKTLRCTPGSWTNAPTSYRYQWLRGGRAIARATTAKRTLAQADTGAAVSCRVIAVNAAGASAAATSRAVTVAFATVTTKTTIAKQAGAAIVTFTKASKASKKGALTLAKVHWVGAGTATVSATGTLKAGSAKYAIKLTRRVGVGKTATLTVKLSAKARAALSKKGGTLTVKVAVGSRRSRSTSARVTVKRS